MIGEYMRCLLPVWLCGLLIIGLAGPAHSCPFCAQQDGQTLTKEVLQATMVLFGTLTNARLDPNGGFGQGATDLKIEAVVKGQDVLKNQKVITLPRYVPTDNTKSKFLIFCDVFNGKIDPYRGIPVKPDSDMVKYLTKAVDIKEKDAPTRLKFFFDYLDNADLEISNDAYKEFANADYKDYRDMSKKLPPEKIVKWLKDPETPAFRLGLYASMLGHCGSEKHAEVLHSMLEDQSKRLNSGVDGMLAAYALLKPKEGWEYLRGFLKDSSKEFMVRYAALRAARFFWDSRPDVVDKVKIVAAVCLLLDQNDIADLAIEDLRKWIRWEVADEVLSLANKKSHDVPIIKRAILRYALACPDKKCAAYVEAMRKKDAEMVKDVEELLKLESPPPAKPPTSK
jgi:hypothetical protein